jgi:hypothetical protein
MPLFRVAEESRLVRLSGRPACSMNEAFSRSSTRSAAFDLAYNGHGEPAGSRGERAPDRARYPSRPAAARGFPCLQARSRAATRRACLASPARRREAVGWSARADSHDGGRLGAAGAAELPVGRARLRLGDALGVVASTPSAATRSASACRA